MLLPASPERRPLVLGTCSMTSRSRKAEAVWRGARPPPRQDRRPIRVREHVGIVGVLGPVGPEGPRPTHANEDRPGLAGAVACASKAAYSASMDKIERQLLDNMLDALDRLYDRESSALDIQALARATAAAVSSPDMADMARELSDAASALLVVVRSRLGEKEYDAVRTMV